MGFGTNLKGALGLAKGPKGSFTSGNELVRQQDLLNRYNISSPFGSRSFSTDAEGRSVLNIEETPFQQALRGLQEQQALGVLGSAAPSAEDFAQQGQDISNALYQSSLYNLTPQFQKEDVATADYLANRGLSPTSEAYRTALRDLRRSRGEQLNQLGLQSTLAGTAEQDRLVRLAEAQRAARLAETGSATQGLDLGLLGDVAGIDAAGIISGQEAASNFYNLSRFQDAQQRRSQTLNEVIKGGFGGAGGGGGDAQSSTGIGSFFSGIGSFFSDKNLKENIEKVGEENGFNIYEFNYINEPNKRYRGVIAQEIKEIAPDAIEERDGYLAVNYDKIGIEFKEV